MDDAQLLRYSRHILLPELGLEAQQRFAAADALVVGAGGLGAPVAQFLAAATNAGDCRSRPTVSTTARSTRAAGMLRVPVSAFAR